MVATPFHCSSGSLARLGNQRTVDLPGRQQPDEERGHRPAVLRVVDLGRGTHRVALDHRTEPVGGWSAGDLPVGVRRVRSDLCRLHGGVLVGGRRSKAATAPRSADRRGGRSPSTASIPCTSSPTRADRCPRRSRSSWRGRRPRRFRTGCSGPRRSRPLRAPRTTSFPGARRCRSSPRAGGTASCGHRSVAPASVTRSSSAGVRRAQR